MTRAVICGLLASLFSFYGCAAEQAHVSGAEAQAGTAEAETISPASADEKTNETEHDPDALIAQLGAAEFSAREAAEKALMQIGEPVVALLRKHENDKDPESRMRIRRIIERITGSETWGKVPLPERMRVAADTATPKQTLRQLANDKNPHVRWRVARNPNTPPEILRRLLKDVDKDVRKQAEGNLRIR